MVSSEAGRLLVILPAGCYNKAYSQRHPVYLALRELGRAVRTEFLLRHMDNQDLRKRTDDQLESTHSFTRAVFYGQNGRFPTPARRNSS